MFRSLLTASAVSAVALLAGCSAAPGDDTSQSNDEALAKPSTTDSAFLMELLARAGVPAVAPPAHVVGAGASREAIVDLKVVSGGLAGLVTQTGDIAADDGTAYGAIDKAAFGRTSQVLIKGGVSWTKGEVRCCDVPTTDTLSAKVSCHSIVAPGSPITCTITAAPVAKDKADAFMYALLTGAGVTPDTRTPAPGAGTPYTARIRVSKGGIAGVELGSLTWGVSGHAALAATELSTVEKLLTLHGAVWGASGVVHPDSETTLEAEVTCSESVTARPVAHCTYRADNVRPL